MSKLIYNYITRTYIYEYVLVDARISISYEDNEISFLFVFLVVTTYTY